MRCSRIHRRKQRDTGEAPNLPRSAQPRRVSFRALSALTIVTPRHSVPRATTEDHGMLEFALTLPTRDGTIGPGKVAERTRAAVVKPPIRDLVLGERDRGAANRGDRMSPQLGQVARGAGLAEFDKARRARSTRLTHRLGWVHGRHQGRAKLADRHGQ
jgi:hypothetical protein